MTTFEPVNLDNAEEFLAHMLALKCETEDRLQELADCLEEHHNLEAADVFRHFQGLAADGVKEIERLAEGYELPSIAIWEYEWHSINSPENACIDNAHYLMSSRQALELARFNSRRTHNFLLEVINSVQVQEIQEFARQLINHEEQVFIHRIEQWMKEICKEDISLCDDLDPPNTQG